MTRPNRDPLIRAGRPPKLSKVLAQCNADAERMRREADLAKPAPVVLNAPRGCSECGWGKVLGCWRCGGR